ncbi:Hsp70 family protein [Anaplasma phagocytophilum]|uniref:Hsp70 family protein n=1 Tax=Anaplasma phagocytophilum str. ApNP TaxID=1359153 RepID=A0A0F3NJI5_ANAPH|nr:hsp70 family protein [Anaplasma phagocytophilum str. ApNP]
MQLVDIVEPDVPDADGMAFGIDLGTTHSLVARMENGQVRIFQDASGRCLIPSVVEYCNQGEVRVGHDAAASSIRSIKRLMGKSISDVGNSFSGIPVAEHNGGVALGIDGRGATTPVEISAEILKYLNSIVKDSIGEEIKRAVVTVPAYFDEVARKATRDAATRAGIEVIRLLNEPTAAALVYGEKIKNGEICLVYDLGGGTFDVSIVKMHDGVMQIVATGGDTNLGGDDIDYLLAELVLGKYRASCSVSSGEISWSLLLDAKKAKEEVSAAGSGEYEFRVGDVVFSCAISIDEFSEIVDKVLSRTLEIVKSTMLDADLVPSEVAQVILVGGSSRLPHVKLLLEKEFPGKVYDDIDPESVVVTGAAIQAYNLSNPLSGTNGGVLVDIVPLSLAIEVMGGIAEVLIPRNTPVPALVSQEFTTYVDGQTSISIHVCQGERELVSENRSLAKFDFEVLPLPAGEARIRVEFRVDMDGMLTVSAQDNVRGIEKSVEINSLYGVTETDIEQCVRDSVENFDSDMHLKELGLAKAECTRILEKMKDIIALGGLSEVVLNDVRGIMLRCEAALSSQDIGMVRDISKQLNAKIVDLKKKEG